MNENRSRFEKLALPFLKNLHHLALHLTRNPVDSSDLVQDTYLRAYQYFSNFQEGTNCKAWLFAIMYSIFVNQQKRKRREPVPMPDEEIDRKYGEYTSSIEAGSPPMIGSEVAKALEGLAEVFRTPVVLVDLEGFTYEEVAQVLECPVGTVRSRLFRGRKLLYVTLRQYAEQLGYSGKQR